MFEKKLALHETLEFHEVINFKTVCLLKSKMMQGIVFDQDLKALMEKDVKQSTLALTAMIKLYSNAELK
ncbi:spore coat protein [Psychrobacillus lasiicapitis]|uniref:Spore coat protein n=1 Tax=Psychrobacillus lasiicapitis TaxID=1636719 RepID=A0A544SSI2_9BACI|nr:spore coat protein [Psychrobacillus lasiicapitis]TQR08169.1 spore coat protein [Psychrobacillus lasiicapitis]GGA49278.1 spore coat protein F-like protein YraG [Psychrobacillus lasiicapitis]